MDQYLEDFSFLHYLSCFGLPGGGASSIRDQCGPDFGRTYPYLNCGGAGPVTEAARGLSGRNLDAGHLGDDRQGKRVKRVARSMSRWLNNVEKHVYAYFMTQHVLQRGTPGQGRWDTHPCHRLWAEVHPWEHLSSRLGCLRSSGECPRQCRGRASGTNRGGVGCSGRCCLLENGQWGQNES